MSMILAAMAAILLSAIPIVLLCIGDPKRRRSSGEKGQAMGAGYRRTLATIACVPGFACAVTGDSAAFMMWLGGCALVGWAAAFWFRTTVR